MRSLRAAALFIAGGRIAIGAPIAVAPAIVSRWIGPDAEPRAVHALSRGLAGRDLALGFGLLTAVARDEGIATWLAAGAMADAADLVGTGLAGDDLPTGPRRATEAIAGGAALAGLLLAVVAACGRS